MIFIVVVIFIVGAIAESLSLQRTRFASRPKIGICSWESWSVKIKLHTGVKPRYLKPQPDLSNGQTPICWLNIISL